jgi:hypothetical protein
MISRTDEPMEGVVFDVQDHTRRTGTRGPGTHGEMISSDLHGAEEPIRWLLGWQRQDSVMMSPCMKKTEGRPHQDTLAEIDLWGSAPADGMMALMDRTPPRAGWTFSGADGSVLGLFGTCGRLQEPQRGQRFAFWMMMMP